MLGPWYMLDKSYDKSIRESAAKGMADGIVLERNVRSGNIIIIGLDEVLLKYVNLKARYEHSDSSIVARQLLAKGIEEDRMEFAAKIFKERKVSLREAAEIAGISATEMIEILKERGIKLDYSLESLRREIREIYKELGLDVSRE